MKHDWQVDPLDEERAVCKECGKSLTNEQASHMPTADVRALMEEECPGNASDPNAQTFDLV